MKTKTAATRTAAQIRREFIDFFVEKHGHTFVPSSPVVPHDDPTLLFANAGMNQFKDVFLGTSAAGSRDYTRAVNSQKCIRAGGKHNDLEDVGKDTYHHTFFEMLGNWSFGDYFKAEAIEWAWDLLTTVWGLDKTRLYVTVFAGDEKEGLPPDDEAEQLWKQHTDIDRSHISRWGKKDNFWEMGDTGPCGPCSEIHYDFTPNKTGRDLVNAGDPRVIELWNLVFIQFNRSSDGKLSPLPAKHVDTGLGLERLVRVLQHVQSNYDIDLFTPIFKAIETRTGAHGYRGTLDDPIDIAYRVIADHVRCLTVAITDGGRPGNEGRGYVLRRILRRAVRHAHQTLQTKAAWLHELVPTVVRTLGDAFHELKEKPTTVAEIICDEEDSFLRKIDNGIRTWWSFAGYAFLRQFHSQQLRKPREERLVMNIMGGGYPSEFEFYDDMNLAPFRPESNVTIERVTEPGKDNIVVRTFKLGDVTREVVAELCDTPPEINAPGSFKLHDTYGFPIDLTRVMAEERGMTVDEAGFEKLMGEARERSRGVARDLDDPFDVLANEQLVGCDDSPKYVEPFECAAQIASIARHTKPFDTDSGKLGEEIVFSTDRTPFYAEQGGQVSDTGTVHTDDGEIVVTQVRQRGDHIVHRGRVTNDEIAIGTECQMKVDRARRVRIMQNHTATHLLNFALREVVGPEEDQKGSLVAPDRLRFDFSCSHAMSAEQVEQTERLVNATIEQELEVFAEIVPLAQAKSIAGLRAVFGEKYPDPVRVVAIGVPLAEVLKDPGHEQWKEFSIELCGGTHLQQTGKAKQLIIIQEQALAAGVRRITALTGQAAHEAEAAGRELELRAARAAELGDDKLLDEFNEITARLEALTIGTVARGRIEALLGPLRDRVKRIHKHAQAETRAGAVDQARQIASDATGPIIVEQLSGADRDSLLSAMDVIRAKHPAAAVMLFGSDESESKVSIVARVPEALIECGLKAGDWVREAAKVCGGRGGGRADMAQAGAKNPAKVPDAVTGAKTLAEQKLK